MSQSSKMNAALKKYVFQPLLDNGFTGQYPHYRKVKVCVDVNSQMQKAFVWWNKMNKKYS